MAAKNLSNKDLNPKRITLDDRLVKCLENSISGVLGQFFGLQTKFEAPFRGRDFDKPCDLSGVISIFQENIQGILSLGFQRDMIFSLMKKIYNREFTAVEQPIIDGVGEITNSVYGQVKREMNENGFELQMAIPSVIVGRGHSIMHYSNRPTLILPVRTELGDFHASVILENSAASLTLVKGKE